MYITELFNKPEKWIPRYHADGMAGDFIINDIKFVVVLEYHQYKIRIQDQGYNYFYSDIFELMFTARTETNDEHHITGNIGKDSIKVFSTVIDFAKHHIEKHNIKNLIFLADSNEQSKVKLYNRFGKMLVNSGWEDLSQASRKSLISQHIVGVNDGISSYFFSRGNVKKTKQVKLGGNYAYR